MMQLDIILPLTLWAVDQNPFYNGDNKKILADVW